MVMGCAHIHAHTWTYYLLTTRALARKDEAVRENEGRALDSAWLTSGGAGEEGERGLAGWWLTGSWMCAGCRWEALVSISHQINKEQVPFIHIVFTLSFAVIELFCKYIYNPWRSDCRSVVINPESDLMVTRSYEGLPLRSTLLIVCYPNLLWCNIKYTHLNKDTHVHLLQ